MVALLEKMQAPNIRLDALASFVSFMDARRSCGQDSLSSLVIDEFYNEVFYPQFEFRLEFDALGYDSEGQKNLGKTIFSEKVILLDLSLREVSQHENYTETLAHEMAHVILQARIIDDNDYAQSGCGTEERKMFEYQADRFAEYILSLCG